MMHAYGNGLHWVRLDGEVIEKAPVQLGDRLLIPDDIITKLGERKRTMFYPDAPVKYVGKVEDSLLFEFADGDGIHFVSLEYIDPLTLLITNPMKASAYDIRI